MEGQADWKAGKVEKSKPEISRSTAEKIGCGREAETEAESGL